MARDSIHLLYGSFDLTPAGRTALRAETSAWRRYVAAVDKVLEPA